MNCSSSEDADSEPSDAEDDPGPATESDLLVESPHPDEDDALASLDICLFLALSLSLRGVWRPEVLLRGVLGRWAGSAPSGDLRAFLAQIRAPSIPISPAAITEYDPEPRP